MGETPLVAIETPYNAWLPWTLERNIQYGILANAHATKMGEGTYVPQLVNTQFSKYGFRGYVGDSVGAWLLSGLGPRFYPYGVGRERILKLTGEIKAHRIQKLVVYDDLGVTWGMKSAIGIAKTHDIPVEYRKLPPDWMKEIRGQSLTSTVLPGAHTVVTHGIWCYGAWCLLRRFRC